MVTAVRLGHRPGLDGLRGVAVAIVVVAHAARADYGGQVGVTIFFVLSGFLITRLLIEERERDGGIDLRAFYLRRARRLLPAVLVVLAVLLLVGIATQEQLAPSLLYYANWSIIDDPHLLGASLGHLWSLAIEEQFYLVWPALMALAGGLPRRVLVVLVVGGAIVSAALRFGMWDAGYARVMYGSDTRVEALLIGCAAALLFGRLVTPSRRSALAAAALVLLLACGVEQQTWGFATVGLTLTALAALAVLLHVVERPGLLAADPLRHLGAISYGLYLIHVPVLVAVRDHGGVATIAGVALAWALAVISYQYVEIPLRHQRATTEGFSAASASTVSSGM